MPRVSSSTKLILEHEFQLSDFDESLIQTLQEVGVPSTYAKRLTMTLKRYKGSNSYTIDIKSGKPITFTGTEAFFHEISKENDEILLEKLLKCRNVKDTNAKILIKALGLMDFIDVDREARLLKMLDEA